MSVNQEVPKPAVVAPDVSPWQADAYLLRACVQPEDAEFALSRDGVVPRQLAPKSTLSILEDGGIVVVQPEHLVEFLAHVPIVDMTVAFGFKQDESPAPIMRVVHEMNFLPGFPGSPESSSCTAGIAAVHRVYAAVQVLLNAGHPRRVLAFFPGVPTGNDLANITPPPGVLAVFVVPGVYMGGSRKAFPHGASGMDDALLSKVDMDPDTFVITAPVKITFHPATHAREVSRIGQSVIMRRRAGYAEIVTFWGWTRYRTAADISARKAAAQEAARMKAEEAASAAAEAKKTREIAAARGTIAAAIASLDL